MILSDAAGQFALEDHALCWVHTERLIHKLDTFTDKQHAAQQRVRTLVWWFYADLKAYRRDPDPRRRTALRARFDRIFRRRTGFATLDRLLERLYANKDELLRVLDRPQVPLHTNGSERDLRPQIEFGVDDRRVVEDVVPLRRRSAALVDEDGRLLDQLLKVPDRLTDRRRTGDERRVAAVAAQVVDLVEHGHAIGQQGFMARAMAEVSRHGVGHLRYR